MGKTGKKTAKNWHVDCNSPMQQHNAPRVAQEKIKMRNINSKMFEGVTLDHGVDSPELNDETEALYIEHCDVVIAVLLEDAMNTWLVENPAPGNGIDDDHAAYESWEHDQFEAGQNHWESLDWNKIPSFAEYMA